VQRKGLREEPETSRNIGEFQSGIAKPAVYRYIAAMSRVELAIEKVKRLDENQAEALLEWLELRQSREALRQRLDAEIDVGLEQLRRGEKISGDQLYAELHERSRRRRAGEHG